MRRSGVVEELSYYRSRSGGGFHNLIGSQSILWEKRVRTWREGDHAEGKLLAQDGEGVTAGNYNL